jgi:uncharacterized Zn finger protein
MVKIEIAEAHCPTCSPDEPTTHVILKKGGLVKCEKCGFVHAIPVKKKKLIKLRVIVSREDKSSTQEVEVDENDLIRVGDELVVEKDDEVSGVRVQSIEMKTKARPESGIAKDIETLWARTIDEVIVKIALQYGATTESINYKANGDKEFEVGTVLNLDGREALITSIKQRDGDHFKRDGQFLPAKDIKRVFTKIITASRPRASRTGGFKVRSSRAYRGTGSDES